MYWGGCAHVAAFVLKDSNWLLVRETRWEQALTQREGLVSTGKHRRATHFRCIVKHNVAARITKDNMSKNATWHRKTQELARLPEQPLPGNTGSSVFMTQVDFKKTKYWQFFFDWCCVACFSAAENCSGYRTCGQCLDQPGCGWCTDPSNTGKGQCIEGSYRGPFQTSVPAPSTLPGLPANPQPALNASMCPGEAKYNWSFIHCPGREELAPIIWKYSLFSRMEEMLSL